jgi:hypothetical protein
MDVCAPKAAAVLFPFASLLQGFAHRECLNKVDYLALQKKGTGMSFSLTKPNSTHTSLALWKETYCREGEKSIDLHCLTKRTQVSDFIITKYLASVLLELL